MEIPPSHTLHEDPRVSPAWGPFFTHEYITYYSLQPHDWIMELPQVRVQANPNYGDWPIGPKHEDLYKEGAVKSRDITPVDAVDCMLRNGDFQVTPPELAIEPWKILFLYTTEPDMEYDCDLFLHKSQNLTKGSHGYRHMEFTLFGKKFGICTKTFQYHLDAAIRARGEGNFYWSWRFLSRASHYLADLGHPFHIKVLPYRKLLRYLFHPKELYRVLAATHNSHEVFTQATFRSGNPIFREALVSGSREGSIMGQPLTEHIKWYRKNATKALSPIVDAQLDFFGDELVAKYDIMNSDSEEDSAKLTMLVEREAREVLFRDPDNRGLEILLTTTRDLLYEVGRMLGHLYSHLQDLGFGG